MAPTPTPPLAAQPEPTMADMVVRAMRDPRHHWADVRHATDASAREFESSAHSLGMKRHPTRRDVRLMGDAMMNRMVRGTAPERARVLGAVTASRRFVLDSRFIEAVFPSMMLRDPDRLADTIQLARLPFPSVFIEMSDDELMQAAARHDGAVVNPARVTGRKAGILVERIHPDDPTSWTATVFRLGANGVTVVPFASSVSTTGEPLPEPRLPFRPVDQGLLPPDAAYVPLGIADPSGPDIRFLVPEGYAEAIGLAYVPLYMQAMGDTLLAMRAAGISDKGLDRAMMEALVNERGLLRFVLAILATLNSLPHTTTEVGPRHARERDGKRTELLPYDVVTLLLGSPEARDFQDGLDKAAEREGHDVRGHWRTLRNPDGTARKRVWVKDHRRGDGSPVPKAYIAKVSPAIPAPPVEDRGIAIARPAEREATGGILQRIARLFRFGR